VDTITFVVTMIDADLAIALLFASTVLSLKWWKQITIHRLLKRSKKDVSNVQEQPNEVNRISSNPIMMTTSSDAQIKSKSKEKTQALGQHKRIPNSSELLNKKVVTCEMIEVGHVISINKQSMTILHKTGQEYIISTYYIREYNQENIVTDISIRYLYHYKSQEKAQLYAQK
jgi:hypothetical protein